jgi:dienelactone hydrolase
VAVAAFVLVSAGGEARAEPPATRPEVTSPYQRSKPLNESVHVIPIEVAGADGKTQKSEFQLTVFHPAGNGPFPVVIFNHGRGPDNAYPSRFRFLGVAGYFVRRGFAVLVPTRVGYGGHGNALDPERGQGCDLESAQRQVESVRRHAAAAIDFAGKQPWADATRVVLAGVSVGGYTAVAAASKLTPRPRLTVNFAGGSGGDPKRRAGQPCNPGRIGSVFETAAKSGAPPSVWIYAVNDRYWGAEHPRQWHATFVAAGGKADLHMLEAIGGDGHDLVEPGFRYWRPILDRHLASQGYAPPRTDNAPPASNFAALDAIDRVPINQAGKVNGYQRFLNLDLPRAFVISPGGGWAFSAGQPTALKDALGRCEQQTKAACAPYAVDDAVVWRN